MILNPGDRFDIRIVPGGIYNLEKNILYPDLEENIKAGNLKVVEGSIEIAEVPTADSVVIEVNVDTANEDKTSDEDVADSTEDQKSEEPPIVDPDTQRETFVCDICGDEFASARSLSAHKNKAHKNK